MFDDVIEAPLDNPRRRPDLVVLPDSTIGVYACDSFDQRAEVNGFDKVLVVELKRGGSTVGIKESRQGEDYSNELRKSGKVQKATKIRVFVLGSNVAEEARDDREIGNTIVYNKSFSVILRQAHSRTFFLQQKIKNVKLEQLVDQDVEEVVKADFQPTLFLRQ